VHRAGGTVSAIAAQAGRSRPTSERSLRLPPGPVPHHRSPSGRRRLPPSQASRRARWQAGCRTALQRVRALPPQGDTGSARRVAASASRRRQAPGLAPRRQGRRPTWPGVAAPACPPLPPRRTTWLVLRRAAKRTAAETPHRAQVRAQQTAVAAAIDLAQDLAQRGRQRPPAARAPWRPRATPRTQEAVQRCATGLHDASEAVTAGGPRPWSNGPVAGPLHRLTMLKRQMCGRARLELRRRRFVGAPRDGPAAAAGLRAPAATHAEAASPRGPPAAGRGMMAGVRGRSAALRRGVAGHGSTVRATVVPVWEARACGKHVSSPTWGRRGVHELYMI